MNSSPFFAVFIAASTALPALADWPQWRGPDRNGIASADADLPDLLPEGYEAEKRWESIEIPSDHYGGHGSVSVANGGVFLSVVWHHDEPTETRKIDGDVLSTLGYRGTTGISAEVLEQMEYERMNLSRRLRGAALDEWAKKWVEDNIDEKTRLSLGSWIIDRFKKGQAAIPLSVYETLRGAGKETFADQAALEAWVDSQNFEPVIRDQIVKAVPSTRKVADDIVLCLDAETGAVKWEFRVPGYPSGRSSSSTPAVADGKVYAALSEHLYCVDAATGAEVWRSPLTGRKGPASSPLVHGDYVYLQQNHLSAFDRATGTEVWKNTEVTGSNSSPAVWNNVILSNTSKAFIGVDAVSGLTLWSVSGGGDSTPVVSGDYAVLSSKDDAKNLICYALSADGAEEKWSYQFLARRYGSSPIIYGDNVYYMGSDRHLCLELATGSVRWEKEAQSSISSPLLADGRVLVYENRGGYANLINASPDAYESSGRAKIGALYCASPALVGKDLYLRTSTSVVSYRFN